VHTTPYLEQRAVWPASGRHILARFDDDTIVVYQAYRPAIADFAVAHQRFGGEFSLARMSWIKPNFLWMMYRCGWATKVGQERVLAVRMRRAGFDEILAGAVHSSFVAEVYGDAESWRRAIDASPVRLQWDPDHDPHGAPQIRRAIQLGLAKQPLRSYAQEWIVAIEDVTPFVRAQHAHVVAGRLDDLATPTERVYPVADVDVARRLGVDEPESDRRR
jgi:hypothetical protein